MQIALLVFCFQNFFLSFPHLLEEWLGHSGFSPGHPSLSAPWASSGVGFDFVSDLSPVAFCREKRKWKFQTELFSFGERGNASPAPLEISPSLYAEQSVAPSEDYGRSPGVGAPGLGTAHCSEQRVVVHAVRLWRKRAPLSLTHLGPLSRHIVSA